MIPIPLYKYSSSEGHSIVRIRFHWMRPNVYEQVQSPTMTYRHLFNSGLQCFQSSSHFFEPHFTVGAGQSVRL